MATKELPLPARQLFIICACRFAEPICFTVLFPFIVSMVRDFKVGDETEVGYYVGFVTSSFALAQLLTGIHWGMLSDRIGRRPVILMGLVGTILSILLFGLSKSYVWALLSRSLCGLLNGNIGVLKSMVSELTMQHAPHQRARAFSLLPLMFGLGSIIGPMLGGFLSKPVEHYPAIFGRGGFLTDFLTEYPYFLPCFISAVICAFGLVFGMFYLEETLAKCIKKEEVVVVGASDVTEENTLLIENHHKPGYDTFSHSSHRDNSPTPTLCGSQSTPPTLRESLTPAVLAICVTYGLFSYQAIFYDELFPIWTASLRRSGGLGFDSDEIGTALAFCGVVTLFAQIVLLPYLTKRFGLMRLFRAVLFILIFLYLGQSSVRLFYNIPDLNGQLDTKLWVWVGLLATVAIKTICHTIAFTACTILTNNAAPRMDALGTVNGFSQCCASGMRAFGPASCGIIWSSSLAAHWIPFPIRVNISFLFLTVVGAVTFYSSKRLDSMDYEVAAAREEVVVDSTSTSDETIARRV
ncbi:major facilitator superfamily domain-containing protein [Radiomyces spectabilis]|uniref:major facilitator superfamily domain-containing protein n=1 Tax=Radiomyces spectabilis TaxID=64574 RepID=UPI00221FBD86|nr:major facilitator superfamily domain-containing protein [Radiomyces spectabilis]KAI8393986.1 major facilitator superfamily domain-containing protein [Radiomyces spectabilis]